MAKPETKRVAPANLDQVRPEALIDKFDPIDLARAVEALDAWTPRRIGVVDDVLSNWVPDAIARPNDVEGLAALQSGILRIIDASASRKEAGIEHEPATTKDFVQRWNGYADAIAARHLKLEERAPERIRKLKHVAEIEAMLADGPIEQSDIQRQVSLTPSRLSQVLSLMESNGMIERESVGKKKRVSTATRANRAEGDVRRKTGHLARGASWLSEKKAA